MTANTSLSSRDRAHVWHPYTQMQTAPEPIGVVRGEGVYLYTESGRRILDGISSWWVNIHGHSHPRLNEALANQARNLEHVVFAGCTHEPAVALAEQLCAVLPEGLTKNFYSDNGSTAVEVAIKMAVQYWRNRGDGRRRELVALHHSYHGDTVGAMTASEASVFTEAFQTLLFPVHRAHAPYCYRCPLGLQRTTCEVKCLESLEQVVAARSDSIAAVIVEPMLQGAGGMIVWPSEFLSGVRKICDRYNILMIADEVLTGFGRTGRLFACEHAAVRPDLVCLSKALTAGYLPLGVTAATEAVYEAFLSDDRSKTFFHGHSYTANPLACAVACASLDLFREERTMERVAKLESHLHARVQELRGIPVVGDARSIGGVAALELVTRKGGYLSDVGPRLGFAFLERGLLLRPLGHILYFMPPYVISESEVDWAFDQIGDVLKEFELSS